MGEIKLLPLLFNRIYAKRTFNEDKSEYPEGMIIYEDNYSTLEFTKYIIKNGRKKVYKNAGGTPRDWKEYIKHI